MGLRCLRSRGVLVFCSLLLASAWLPPAHAGEALPGAAERTVRALFPDAVIQGVEVETDEGLALYIVRLKRGKLTTDVEVSAEGTVGEIETEVGIEDVPEYVAEAIREATRGGTVVTIEKHELRGRVEGRRMVALAEPATVYEVRCVLQGKNRIVEIADTPALKLPPPARGAVATAFPGATVKDVSAEREGGLLLYEAKLEQDGRQMEVEVSAEGTIASVETEAAAGDLPQAVAEAVARVTGGGRVVGFEKEKVRAEPRLAALDSPRIVFSVTFEREGKRGEVEVAADGTVVSTEETDGEADDDAAEGTGQSNLELPQAAREAVEAGFPAAAITGVSSEREGGLLLYEVKLDQAGRRMEVEVSPEGTIASVETAAETGDLPQAVAAAVARVARDARIIGLEKEEVRAAPRLAPVEPPRVVYGVEFVKNGKRYETEVAADGTVLRTEEQGVRGGDDDQ